MLGRFAVFRKTERAVRCKSESGRKDPLLHLEGLPLYPPAPLPVPSLTLVGEYKTGSRIKEGEEYQNFEHPENRKNLHGGGKEAPRCELEPHVELTSSPPPPPFPRVCLCR